MITENVSTLKIHKLTKEQYDRELANGRVDPNALYFTTTEDEEIDLSEYATKDDLNALDYEDVGAAPAGNYATESFVVNKIAEAQIGGGGEDGDTLVDLSGYATKDDLNTKAPAGFGLGDKCVSIDDWDDAILNGFYVGSVNSPDGNKWWGFVIANSDNYIEQRVFRTSGGTLSEQHRSKYNGTWQDWNDVSPSTFALVSHTHEASDVGAVPTSRTVNGKALSKNISLTASDVGASASDHTHSYAGSSSAGGAANSVKTNLTVKLNDGSIEGTDLFTYNGSTAKTINVTPSAIGAASLEYAKKIGAPRNLLDNSYWMEKDEIVNQRKEESYTGIKYTIDRWQSLTPTLTVTLSDGYLILKQAATETDRASFCQNLGTGYVGKTLTLAVCGRSDKVYCFSKTVPQPTSEIQQFCWLEFEEHSVRLTLNPAGELTFLIMVSGVQTANIRWAALYEGEYTADTLPECQPKGYGAELAECQRYYLRLEGNQHAFGYAYTTSATACRIMIPTPVTMRTIPSIDGNPTFTMRGGGSKNIAVNVTVKSNTNNTIRLDGTGTGFPVDEAVIVVPDVSFGLSADL